jgi:hypothetical protein
MDEGKVSRTALMTTFFRAYHYAHASPRDRLRPGQFAHVAHSTAV